MDPDAGSSSSQKYIDQDSKCNEVIDDVKIKLFSTFCSSMHTAQLWWNHSVYSIHRLHVCYNNVFRRLLGLPKYCSASAVLAQRLTPDCKAVIRNLVYKFMSRLDKPRNSLIIAVLGTDIRWKSRIRRQWVVTLYTY